MTEPFTTRPITPDQATAKVEHFYGRKPNPSAKDFVEKERPESVDALKQAWMEEGARLALTYALRHRSLQTEFVHASDIRSLLESRDFGFPVPKPAFLKKCEGEVDN